MSKFKLENKNVVLTGCNSGIGYETLKVLLAKGNHVLGVDRDTDNLDKIHDDHLTVMQMDIASEEGVDAVFEKAEELFDFIDLFYANAGYPQYERLDYVDYNRPVHMFETNVFSQMYTYEKYLAYLDGREGHLAMTISCIGSLALPGFVMYSASKFAMHGFQEGIRAEGVPKNMSFTTLNPIATATNFFYTGNPVKYQRPIPIQSPKHVAKFMVKAIEKGKGDVCPSKLFGIFGYLFAVCPPMKNIYWFLNNIALRSLDKEEAKKKPRQQKKPY